MLVETGEGSDCVSAGLVLTEARKLFDGVNCFAPPSISERAGQPDAFYLKREETKLAQIIGGIAVSHTPTIGFSYDTRSRTTRPGHPFS